IMYAAKKGRVALTPPMKPWLEEKMAFALVHHPALEPFWTHELGADTYELLHRLMPKTWILDPRPVPPHAVIPGLTVDGRSVSDRTTSLPATTWNSAASWRRSALWTRS